MTWRAHMSRSRMTVEKRRIGVFQDGFPAVAGFPTVAGFRAVAEFRAVAGPGQVRGNLRLRTADFVSPAAAALARASVARQPSGQRSKTETRGLRLDSVRLPTSDFSRGYPRKASG